MPSPFPDDLQITPAAAPARVFYRCQRCGACCRCPGFVRVLPEEVSPIAAFLGLNEDDFIQRHTRLTPRRNGLALLDKPNGECAFLRREGGAESCALQAVKPAQCVGFPNAWTTPGWRDYCKAVAVPPGETPPAGAPPPPFFHTQKP